MRYKAEKKPSKHETFNLETWCEEYQSSESLLAFQNLIAMYLQSALEQAKLIGNDFNRSGLTTAGLLLNWSTYLSRRIFFTGGEYPQLKILEDKIEQHIQEAQSLDLLFKNNFEILKVCNPKTIFIFKSNIKVFEKIFSTVSNQYIFIEPLSKEQYLENKTTIFYDTDEIHLESAKQANKLFINAIIYKFLLIKYSQSNLNENQIKVSLSVATRLMRSSECRVIKYSLIQEFHYKFNELKENSPFHKKDFRFFLKKSGCYDLFSKKEISQVATGIDKQRKLYIEIKNNDKDQFINELMGKVRKNASFKILPTLPKENKNIEMHRVVIIGCGPIGLYLASMLEKHTNIDITIVEPRLGEYDREKIISSIPLDKIKHNLGVDIEITKNLPEGAMYIKDFEESLYKNIQSSSKIRWVKGWFVAFKNNNLMIKMYTHNADGPISKEIPCDLVFDCSGTKRIVINGLNNYLNNDIFTTTEIGDNPFKFNCLTYLTLPSKLKKMDRDPMDWARQLNKLKEEFGWPCYAMPNFFIRKARLSKKHYQYFIYYEIPSHFVNVNQEVQLDWLHSLLSFHYECNDLILSHETVTCHELFEVNPLRVKEKFYFGDDSTPAVIGCGDATMEPDWRLEYGISSGMDRVNCLIQAMKSYNDQVVLNFNKYSKLVEQYIDHHINEINELYRFRRRSIVEGSMELVNDIYLFGKHMDNPDDAIYLAFFVKDIGYEQFINSRYYQALHCCSIALELWSKCNEQLDDECLSQLHLLKCRVLIKIIQQARNDDDDLRHDAQNLMEELNVTVTHLQSYGNVLTFEIEREIEELGAVENFIASSMQSY